MADIEPVKITALEDAFWVAVKQLDATRQKLEHLAMLLAETNCPVISLSIMNEVGELKSVWSQLHRAIGR